MEYKFLSQQKQSDDLCQKLIQTQIKTNDLAYISTLTSQYGANAIPNPNNYPGFHVTPAQDGNPAQIVYDFTNQQHVFNTIAQHQPFSFTRAEFDEFLLWAAIQPGNQQPALAGWINTVTTVAKFKVVLIQLSLQEDTKQLLEQQRILGQQTVVQHPPFDFDLSNVLSFNEVVQRVSLVGADFADVFTQMNGVTYYNNTFLNAVQNGQFVYINKIRRKMLEQVVIPPLIPVAGLQGQALDDANAANDRRNRLQAERDTYMAVYCQPPRLIQCVDENNVDKQAYYDQVVYLDSKKNPDWLYTFEALKKHFKATNFNARMAKKAIIDLINHFLPDRTDEMRQLEHNEIATKLS